MMSGLARGSARHHKLQNVIIRLLHDPSLIARLYQDSEEMGEELGLTAEELSWFIEIDRRRWEVDPELPHRSLEGALSHCPVTALVVSSLCYGTQSHRDTLSFKSGIEELLRFYQTPAFHRCIDQGEYLAESLMSWMRQEIAQRPLPPQLDRARQITCALVDLELQVAITRRMRPHRHMDEVVSQSDVAHQPTSKVSSTLSLPSTSQLYATIEGATEVYLALYEEALNITKTHGCAQLLRGQLNLESFPIKLDSPVTALIEYRSSGVSIESLSGGLVTVLKLAQAGGSVSSLMDFLIEADVEPDDAAAMIQDWRREGLIQIS